MYRVLMPVDENEERAMAQARYVADLPEAGETVEVTVLYVYEEESGSTRDPENIGSVARVMEFFEARDITRETQTDHGRAAAAILDESEQLEPDALVLGGRKRSPAGKILFGSVTMQVLRNTDTPVVITGSASMDG